MSTWANFTRVSPANRCRDEFVTHRVDLGEGDPFQAMREPMSRVVAVAAPQLDGLSPEVRPGQRAQPIAIVFVSVRFSRTSVWSSDLPAFPTRSSYIRDANCDSGNMNLRPTRRGPIRTRVPEPRRRICSRPGSCPGWCPGSCHRRNNAHASRSRPVPRGGPGGPPAGGASQRAAWRPAALSGAIGGLGGSRDRASDRASAGGVGGADGAGGAIDGLRHPVSVGRIGAGRCYAAAMKLSILMPVYNERATLESAVKRVLDVDYPVDVELVIVDDGSSDGTRELYPQWAGDPRVRVHLKPSNGGKGSAIRQGCGVGDR